ncbi:hypothetical protein ABT56_22850 [Photobacterium aquae]|uniref:Uncharacterized protein n=1 Tax=Photobacterium aquae TaxID=1195763 RepID=A0A0J1JDL1_9GAMM|nr:hypothetical protein [Photobacterium aquae]KLU99711.1 hypothetical protein ABT56_22850 [Photobacterium aquae]
MLGAMTSLTGGGGLQGGSAGPSAAHGKNDNKTDSKNESGFRGGSINMGSNNGIPTWALLLGGIAIAYMVLKK